MAAFPGNIPGPGITGGTPQAQGPPPQAPGITQQPPTPPAELMRLIAKRPESAQQLIRQAIVLLEQAADLDTRIQPRLEAAIKVLRGPAKPNTEP